MDANAAETLARLIVPMLGMMSVMLARFWPHGTLRSVANGAMLVLLVLVGSMAAMSISMGSEHWLAHGATLSIMAIGSILDFSPTQAVRL